MCASKEEKLNAIKIEILEFIQGYFSEYGKPPSISVIFDNIFGARSRFYKCFSGIEEACQLAGVEVDHERLRSTEAATRAKTAPPLPPSEDVPKIVLNEDMARQIWGICHLEGGKASEIVLSEMIKREVRIRSFGLSLDSEPSLYSYANFLKAIDGEVLADIVKLVNALRGLNWDVSEFMSEVQKRSSLLNVAVRCIIGDLDPETALIELMPR